MHRSHLPSLLARLLLAASTSACAGFGRPDFGPYTLDAPPFHAGRAIAADTSAIAHLPVSFQRGANDPAVFEPDPSRDMGLAQLLAEIDEALDDLSMSRRVSAGGIPATGAPDVRFGCRRETPMDDCVTEDRGLFGGVRRPFQLSAERPQPAWLAAARQAVGDARTPLLVVTLEIGEYPVRPGGFRSTPSVDLGTRHREELPKLQNTDQPIVVLQLTGALLAPDGTVLRAGAEGIAAKRTNVLLGALGVQGLFSDEDLRAIREQRREDLEGRPLAWQVALEELVEGLLQRERPR